MRIIAMEEHYRSPVMRSAGQPARSAGPFDARLDDLGSERIARMDATGIDVQVLLHSMPATESVPAPESVPLAEAINDHLSATVEAHPGRFAGLASLPMAAPLAAADELERGVTELGLPGAVINGHTQGRFLDDPFFWPVLERAHRLQVPIYLHPTAPPDSVRSAYYDGLPERVGHMLATAAWGQHVETGMHVLRMIVGDVFDEFPGLQMIVGHMGEALPFMAARATHMFAVGAGLDKPIEQYLAEHVHFTTSGMFSQPAFMCLLMAFGADRIMFGVDYPFSDNEDGRRFLDAAPLDDGDRAKIAHLNAERLLGLT